MTSWVSDAYTIAAMFVAGLLVYVMQKVETDRWAKTDPLWLQWIRRAAFVITAVALLYSIDSTDWQLTSLVLVSASAAILFINALALSLRAPPKNKGKKFLPSSHYAFSHLVTRVTNYFITHR